MIRHVHCPKCRAPLAISVVVAAPVVRVEEALPRGVPTEPLPVRIERLLAKSGEHGRTVRDLQQHLKGPKSEEIFEVLRGLMETTPPYIVRHIRGAAEYYVLASMPPADNTRRLRAYLAREWCMTERVLYRKLHMSFSEAAKAVDALVIDGTVRVSGAQPRMVHWVEHCECLDSAEVVPQNGNS